MPITLLLVFAMHTVGQCPNFYICNTLFCSGDETGGETPVLIPNTAVKTSRGDGTALCGRVARRQYKEVCLLGYPPPTPTGIVSLSHICPTFLHYAFQPTKYKTRLRSDSCSFVRAETLVQKGQMRMLNETMSVLVCTSRLWMSDIFLLRCYITHLSPSLTSCYILSKIKITPCSMLLPIRCVPSRLTDGARFSVVWLNSVPFAISNSAKSYRCTRS